MKTTPPVCITAVLLLLAAGCRDPQKKNNPDSQAGTKPDTAGVRVLTLAPRTFVQHGEYYGRLTGIFEANLVARMGGTVEYVKVKEGAYVKAGQSLAGIDAEKASTMLETARLNEKVAKGNYDRLRKHLAEGNASQLTVDQAKLAWLGAKSSRIDAEQAYKDALCISPIGGIVISRYIDPYQKLGPGSPTFYIAQTQRMKLTVGIPESDMKGLREGNRAEVTVDLYPDEVWKGTVHRIARGSSRASRMFQAEVRVPNASRRLKPGMTANVRIVRKVMPNQIVVPAGVISADGDENYVMRVSDGKAVRTPVMLGPSCMNETVIEKGLDSGDVVITAGLTLVGDGSPVRVVE